MASENNYRRIRHGMFSYFAPVKVVDQNGEEAERFTEQLAFRGQVIEVPRDADLARGEEFGAFEDERFDKDGNSLSAPEPVASEEEGEEVELSDLDDDELVDWLLSTGQFDGEPKPTVQDVVDGAGGNPELAKRLLDAENTASGGKPRTGVEEGLTRVAQDANE